MRRQTRNNDMVDEQLRIMQYNVNKRKEVIDSILNDTATKDFAILLIQEQYRQKYTNLPPIHQSWTLIEPTTKTDTPPRSAIYIRENCTDTHETYVICANTHVRIRILAVFQLLHNSSKYCQNSEEWK